ncbi:MAG: LysE family translocator, partial [Rhodospirillaceae bacterium]|nr:LysE family translocator [Rhodospirillaceae bacterium]
MSLELYAAYAAACVVIVLVPGPIVSVVVANALRHGTRAGLINVAGAQLGLAIIVATVGIGLTSAVTLLGEWFDWIRIAGAAYLVWIGLKMILHARRPVDDGAVPVPPRAGFFWQGTLVALSNPKALLFFGAFFPQFIDPAGNYALQIVIMGATAMLLATIADGTYAVLAGRAGRALSRRRLRLISQTSGGILILG